GVKQPGIRRVCSDASSRVSSARSSGRTRRIAPGVSSTPRSRPSGEKQPYVPPTFHHSFQEPTSQSRQPPPVVSSQRPSGLKATPQNTGTRSSLTNLPVAASQTLAPKLAVVPWVPVATQRPSGLTAQLRTSC